MSDEKCSECRFWQIAAETNRLDSAFTEDGLCRRYPPKHMPAAVSLLVQMHDEMYKEKHNRKIDENGYMNLVYEESKSPLSWIQPVTDRDDWCGEFQRKPLEVIQGT